MYVKMIKDAKIRQGECDNCGEDNHDLLEFAHWNRDDKCKIFNTKTQKYMSYGRLKDLPYNVASEELSKGRFLCICCHRDETRLENATRRTKTLLSLNTNISSKIKKTKTCACCKITKSVDCFYKCKKSTHRYVCKPCDYAAKMARRDAKVSFINLKKIEAKACAECKFKVDNENAYLFDWDHVSRKNWNVSRLVYSKEDKILDEIKLCQLLCCKCHRLKSIACTRSNSTSA